MSFITLILFVFSFTLFANAHEYQKCYTISGYRLGNYGRTTITSTLKPTTTTLTKTSTVVTTSILAPVTDTITTTETSTSTEFETSTSTIPAPAGFTPVTESSGYTSANTPGAKRRQVLDLLLGRATSQTPARYPKGYSPKTYHKPTPRGVKCVVTTQSTRTVKTTVTTTSTSIIVPIPVTSTVTDTTTTTTTSTSTTSFYAACATNNILGPVANPPGQYVQGVGNSDPNGVQQNIFPVASAYDCCVICLTGSTGIDNCQNTIYDADTQICNPIGGDPGVCGPGGTQGDIGSYVILTTNPMNRFDSNGPCGVLGPDPAA